MYIYKRMSLSYNKVLRDFGQIDLDIFSPVLTKPRRGRPPAIKTPEEKYIDIFGEFGTFDDSLFGSMRSVPQIIPPKKSTPIIVPPTNYNIVSQETLDNTDWDFVDEIFEGEVQGDLDIMEVLNLTEGIITDFLTDGNYNEYDIGKVMIYESIDSDDIAYESEYMPLYEIPGLFTDDFIDTEGEQFYNKVWSYEDKAYIYTSKSFTIAIRIVKNPNTGNSSLKIKSVDDLRLKKSVVCINNKDNLCFFRCIAVAIAKEEKHEKLSDIVKGRNIQLELANKLMKELNIYTMNGIETIKKVESYLNCCITIIDSRNFLNVSYPNTKDENYEVKEWNIYLLKTDNHFDLINNNMIAGFFCMKYYCHKCKKCYNNKSSHVKECQVICKICCSRECDCAGFTEENFNKLKFKEAGSELKDGFWNGCLDCNRWFPSIKCFNIHKEPKIVFKGKKNERKEPSICQSSYKCLHCKKTYFDLVKFPKETHKCGDYWCKNCDCIANEGHKCYMNPRPLKNTDENYIFFDFEAEQEDGEHHVNYSISQYLNSDENIEHFNIDEFCKWLLREQHRGYTVIAHNGRGYDFQFIMKWIYANTVFKPSVVYAGSKIMVMKIKELKIRFVDSLNFLTMPLKAFPKTFGIKELKKGYFPHFFNIPSNFYYIGEIPDKKYFGYNSFKTKEREDFIKWWEDKKNNNYLWNQYEEMKTYCISDVDILKKCCIKFRELYLEIADIDPFKYTTIASVCMAIYKAHNILDNYHENYPYDGDTETKKQYQNECLEKVREEGKIAILPYEQQQFIRRAFFGGRTNATKLKYTFKENEEGIYSDITSLYPTVNYYDEYPMGHPEDIKYQNKSKFTGDYYIKDGKKLHKSLEFFGDINKYFGFIECDIESPTDLYFPVLPNKGKKLLFNLENKTGVWATPEIHKAIKMGYKITRIYRVLHFKNKTTNLFKDYVSKFLKIKQEASGFPEWVETEEDKYKYIDDYYKNQGIKLNYDKIVYNPGLRAIAKLCLNSLWGKFGQRLNMPKTEIIGVENKQKYQEIMFDRDKYKNQNFHMIDKYRMEVVYTLQDNHIEESTDTNIAIACFTTSHARMRLYKGLELLNRQVLYHDTDSIVYIYNSDEKLNHKKLENGDLLGEWTDELEGKKMIGTFISGGPKNYSYETDDGKYHTKIKGFTLNYEATLKGKLNHQSMIDMVDNYMAGKDTKIEVKYTMIGRDKKTKQLKSYVLPKKYGFSYDKRKICKLDADGNIDTLPHGFKE